MKPVTQRWMDTIGRPHQLAIDVVWRSAESSDTALLTPTAGTVTLDALAAIRGRMDLTFNEESDVPKETLDRLAPYGNEIQVLRGIEYSDGMRELVSLGHFIIEDTNVTDTGSTLVTKVSGLDRARRLQNAKFENPYEVPKNTIVSEAILACAQAAWPDVPYRDDLPTATALTLPKVVAAEGDDRWEFMRGMAQAIGHVLYFDGNGEMVLAPYAPTGPAATLAEGEGGVLVSATREWTRDHTFNRFIVTGENSETEEIYRAVATDDNPVSPTYYYGPFGRVPKFWQSPYVDSDQAAQDAATAMLAQEIGTSANVSFGTIVNPALEPEDAITIRRDRLNVDATYVIDSVTIGLGPGDTMSGTTREVLIL